MSQETPRQLLNRTIKEYRNQVDVLKAIAESATPANNGYIISTELLDAVRKALPN